MPQDHPTPISRFDLVAAAANFTLVNEKRGNFPYDEDSPADWKIRSRPDRFEIIIYPNAAFSSPPHVVQSNMCKFHEARIGAAEFVAPVSESDSAALRVSWKTAETYTRETKVFAYWPEPVWAVSNGLNLDALLYSAAEKSDLAAARLYLDAGADPLRPTYERDCAARLGVSKGMIEIFSRPEWLDAVDHRSGETGLFYLEQILEFDAIKQAYRMGADPDVRNKRGESVLDLLDGGFERQVREAIAEAEARKLQQTTGAGLCTSPGPGRRRRI